MPRPRKYDYQKDYPVRYQVYFSLPVEIANQLDELGYDDKRIAEEVENYLKKVVENSKNTGS